MERPLLRILMIEDEELAAANLSRMLEQFATFPYQVDLATTLADGIERVRHHPVDIVLLDLNLPDSSALSTLERFREVAVHMPVIVITGQTRGDWAVTAIQKGASDYLFKESLDGADLVRAIRHAMDRKRAGDELIEDQNLLHALLDGTTDSIYFKDADGRFTRINRALSQRFGLAHPSEAIGLTDADFYQREHADEAKSDEATIMQTGHPVINKEEHEIWPDGHETWVSSTKMPLRDAGGHIVGTFGISRDITRRKRAEQELQNAEMFLASIVENIPNMIFVKAADSLRFVRFNRAGEELLGYSRDELLGKSDYDFFPKSEADFFTSKDREVLRAGKIVDIPEERIATRHKGERILHTVKIPLLDAQGCPQYLLGISEDITDRIVAEQERQRAEAKEREVMERTDRLNTIGLLGAGMAHEINNPLQGMMSHLSRVKRSVAEDHAALTSLLMVERGVESISTLVQKLLTLGSTSREYRLETAECGQALRFVAQLTESQLLRAGIALKLEGENTPITLAIPEKELIQVLLNLMINSRDAMPNGGTLTVSVSASADSGVIAVKDTGEGMTDEVRQNIFTPFYTTKGKKGTGLGLVVAASLIHASGGEIEVESAPGEGSTFVLRIPLVKGYT